MKSFGQAQLTIRLDKEMLADLAMCSHETGIGLETAIQRAIRAWLGRQLQMQQPERDPAPAAAPDAPKKT